jgi:hypothetical protein
MSQQSIIIVVLILVALFLYFAGFISGTVPHMFKKMFELADMSEKDASSFMGKICDDPDYNGTLLNIVRIVQGKSKEDEAANDRKLLTLGRAIENCPIVAGNNQTREPAGTDGPCIMGEWVNGDCSVDCGIGMQTRTRTKIGGACIEDIEEEEIECAIECAIEDDTGGTQECTYEEGECIFPNYENMPTTTCGSGTKTRTRTVGQAPCNIPSTESVSCNVPCPACSYYDWEGCRSFEGSQTCDDGYQTRIAETTANCTGDQIEIRACNSCDELPVNLPVCRYDASLSTYDTFNQRFNVTLTESGGCPESGGSLGSLEGMVNFIAKSNACTRFGLDCGENKSSGIFWEDECFIFCANSEVYL